MGSVSSVLREAYVKFGSSEKCQNSMSKFLANQPNLREMLGVSPLTENMFCAAGYSGDGVCYGDSGGPLTIQDHRKSVQLGIVSWGIGCGKKEYPGVFVNV